MPYGTNEGDKNNNRDKQCEEGTAGLPKEKKMVCEHNVFLVSEQNKKLNEKLFNGPRKEIINSHFKRYIKTFFVVGGCWASIAGKGSALVAVDIFIIFTLEYWKFVCVFCWR